MHAIDQPDYWVTFLKKLGKFEIGLSIAMLLVSFALTLSQKFELGLVPQGAMQLLPLLLLFGGFLFAGAGGAVRKYPAFATLIHVPLVIWIGVVFMTFA
jgi:hypothetical protein